jgi:hypothetical protein
MQDAARSPTQLEHLCGRQADRGLARAHAAHPRVTTQAPARPGRGGPCRGHPQNTRDWPGGSNSHDPPAATCVLHTSG